MSGQIQLSHLFPGSQEAVPLGSKNYATSMQECSNSTQCSADNQEIIVGSLHRNLCNQTELHLKKRKTIPKIMQISNVCFEPVPVAEFIKPPGTAYAFCVSPLGVIRRNFG